MNDKFFTALENILYRLNTTLGELNLSSDELYAYSKQYKFNRDELEAFITETHNKMKEKPEEDDKQFTEADYLELIKLSRSPEYSDSMVYYRGKILGRCPAGTTKVGKTCAPAQKEELGAKYKKNVLGGLSKQQVARLSKAKSTEQIIEAHKEKDKEKTDD
jgi:hypothetical protein